MKGQKIYDYWEEFLPGRKTRSGNNAKVVFPVLLEPQVVAGREAVNSRKFKSVCCSEKVREAREVSPQTGGPSLFLLARLTSSIKSRETEQRL